MGWTILDNTSSSTSPIALLEAGALLASGRRGRSSSASSKTSSFPRSSVRDLNNKQQGERSSALHSRQLLLTANLEACRRTLNELEKDNGELLVSTTARYETLLAEQRALDDEIAEQKSFIKDNRLSAMADLCTDLSEQLEACELKGEGPREIKLDRRKSLLLGKSLTSGKGGPLTPGGTPSVHRVWPCGFHGSVDVEIDLNLAGLGKGRDRDDRHVVVPGRSGPLEEARAAAATRRRASWCGEELNSVSHSVSFSHTGENEETQSPAPHRRSSSVGDEPGLRGGDVRDDDETTGAQSSLGSRQNSRMRAVVAFGAAVLPEKA